MQNEILATVTKEEAEQMIQATNKMVKSVHLMRDAEQMRLQAEGEKKAWKRAIVEKYGITEDRFQFNEEDGTLTKMESTTQTDIITKIVKALAGLKLD